jgi:hypothetical protein
VSRRSDFSYEMPGDLPSLEDALAPFAEEVRFAVSGPPPVPTRALASVLAGGFSNPSDKGDLLVTAASNVHGPAPQAAGLPKWKEERDMPVTGLLAGLLAKASGVGTAAKAAVASVTAVMTMGLAGGAAGLLPGPAQTLVASAVGAATPFEFPNPDDVAATVSHAVGSLPEVTVPVTVPPLPVAPPVSVDASAKAGSTSASAKTAAPAATPTLPSVPGVPALPNVSVPPAVSNLVNGLPACVKNLVPTNGGTPDPARLASQIPSCITQVLSTANLPPQVATCVSSILGAIGGASGMSAAAVPSISSLNVSACVPMDQSACVTNMMSTLANIPGFGSLPGVSNLPGLSNVSGCVPMNVTACITSITSAVPAGTTTVPKLDLSACMPTSLPTTGLPGVGSIPGLGSLPGLGGALPFFGG